MSVHFLNIVYRQLNEKLRILKYDIATEASEVISVD